MALLILLFAIDNQQRARIQKKTCIFVFAVIFKFQAIGG